jgi:hypothetical protein
MNTTQTLLHEANPTPIYCFATGSGGTTLDQGEGGGNPFASAFVNLFSRQSLTLDQFLAELGVLTLRLSRGFQHPEIRNTMNTADLLQLVPRPSIESRIALVLVFSDYRRAKARSLPGAKWDAGRVASSLVQAEFSTDLVIDPTRDRIDESLRRFATQSTLADVALLYTTGHGVEVAGTVYLLPGDYPVVEGNSGLARWALPIRDLAVNLQAKRANLVLYAGCRNDPFSRARSEGCRG